MTGKKTSTWQFCVLVPFFGMVSSRDPNSKVGDLQLADKKVTSNHLVALFLMRFFAKSFTEDVTTSWSKYGVMWDDEFHTKGSQNESSKPFLFHTNPAEWMNYHPSYFFGQKLETSCSTTGVLSKELGGKSTHDYSGNMSNTAGSMIGKAMFSGTIWSRKCPIFFTKIQGRFVQCSYLEGRIQTDDVSIFCGFSIAFLKRGSTLHFTRPHSCFLYKLGVQPCDSSPSWQFLTNFQWPSGLWTKGTSESGSSPIHWHYVRRMRKGQTNTCRAANSESVWVAAPKRNEVKFRTCEPKWKPDQPLIVVVLHSAPGSCRAKLQRLGGNCCGSPLFFFFVQELFMGWCYRMDIHSGSIHWHVWVDMSMVGGSGLEPPINMQYLPLCMRCLSGHLQDLFPALGPYSKTFQKFGVEAAWPSVGWVHYFANGLLTVSIQPKQFSMCLSW